VSSVAKIKRISMVNSSDFQKATETRVRAAIWAEK